MRSGVDDRHNKLHIMSKGNMLLGHARGKVGSLVFARVNGQQVTRARAEVIKNPQTRAQMVQRIILNTVCQAYSKMQPIVDHSFEGVAPGQDSMSRFMKLGLSNLREELKAAGDFEASWPTFVALGTAYYAVNSYPISRGTLPEVAIGDFAANGAPIAVTGNTYADVISSLQAERGDQLTIIAIEGTAMNAIGFRYARIILDPRETDGTEASLDSPFIVEGIVNKPNPKNEWNGATLSFDSNQLLIGVGTILAGASAVLSRQKTDGSWLRSNANVVVSEDVAIGLTMAAALEAFESGSLDIVSERYLNNAVRGRAISLGGGDQPIPPVPVPAVTSAQAGGTAWTGEKSVSSTVAANYFEVHAQNAVGKYAILDTQSATTVTNSKRIIGQFDENGVAKNANSLAFQEETLYLKIVASTDNGAEVLATDTRRVSHSDL